MPACLPAAETAIPHTCHRQDSGCIAGWSEHVQPLRATYHYEIHKVKRNEEYIVSERVADAL